MSALPPVPTMASSSTSSLGDKQLQRIIRDLNDAVLELSREHKECLEPVTDDSENLHKFFYKLEYLLQFDQKEKTTFLGQRKDYWDYFCDCLIKIKGANDGIRFVKSIPELKTSLGKGRAFIRYSLVHQRLADTLQQCLINQKVTSDWYYSRSPFLKSHLTADIVNHLYELNQIQFDVAARGYDLDADWPKFARRTLGSGSLAYLWKPPSRCSSINSLVSSYSHTQAQDCVPVPEFTHSFLGELEEPSPCSIAEDLHIELDKSELRQQGLLVQVQELKAVVRDLQGQLSAQRFAAEDEKRISQPQNCRELQDRLTAAEHNNMELLSKLDETLQEKGQQAASFCDSAWKIQDLVDKLKTVEEEKLETKREAEGRTRHSERLSQELKLREEELRSTEEKLGEVKAGAQDEREEALNRLEELQSAVGQIQGALTLKEKESGNLRAQLQDLQASLECRERQAEELKKKLQEEREQVVQRSSMSSEQSEGLILTLQKTLKQKEKELAASSERNKDLEEKLEKINAEKETLSSGMDVEEHHSLEDYRNQCSRLKEANALLLQAVRGSEETIAEMTQTRTTMLEQLASLKASDNHLRALVHAAGLCVEEREQQLSRENLHLEEALQKTLINMADSDVRVKKLKQENQELLEIHSLLKKQSFTDQQEVNSLNVKVDNLEKKLATTQRSHAELVEKLQEAEVKLSEQMLRYSLLQARAEELASPSRDAQHEKGAAESIEKLQKLHQESQNSTETKDANIRLVIAQAQLELNLREVTCLHEEVLELRAQLLAGSEEKMKVQALQEVTEASREDLRLLVEQLKAQVEELNRRHVDEILRSREREEALIRERDGEAQARVGLAAEVTASKEELDRQKLRYEALCLENSEQREALHRANTETAELGVHVCMLTAENDEARLRCESLSSRLQELEKKEAERLNTSMDKLCRESQDLCSWLHGEKLQSELSQAKQEASKEEVQELCSQLSRQTECHQKELQAANQRCCRQIEEKSIQMVDWESLIRQKEDEIIHLKENLSRSEESLKVAQRACQELDESLRRLTQDKKSIDLKTAAELDDLYRTKIYLEERLIELIRDKDALWQKSDALEFEQKLRDEDAERNFCTGCHTQFSWWLHKYNCRLCGRPFCYYCCSNTVSIQQGGSTNRCCGDCYTQHSAVVERHPQADRDQAATHIMPETPLSRLLRAGLSVSSASGADEEEKLDNGMFDIITEEEVSGVQDQDLLCGVPASSLKHVEQGAALLAADWTPEEDIITAVQDAEICLLKSGELTLATSFMVEDISNFGDRSRELFIKSNCYSTISISMRSAGPTVCWTFTSEPKSISFSLLFRDSVNSPLEQAKVLIPLTRCNSHRETIQGEMKVRKPGEYTLVFDNSFSRFISKRVLYQLSLDRPVVYDGSDFL